MIKNQHLLGGLVVLGVINVLAFLGLVSGENASARAIKELTSELAKARDEQRQTAETLGRENRDLRRDLDDAVADIKQLKNDVESLRERLSRTRKALEAVEEREQRLNKPGAREGDGKEAGQ
jgi:septal ring factor EnvC (AmiA/AmiB activator)